MSNERCPMCQTLKYSQFGQFKQCYNEKCKYIIKINTVNNYKNE